MTKKTRYFMAGSAAVLGVGLCTGLVAFYAGGFQPVSAAPVATELRYVPADSAVIAYADLRSIMDSELRTRLKEAIPMHEQGQEEFKAHTGIDIERDIDYIVAAASAPNASSPMAGGLVVARGRFDQAQLEGLAIQHGGEIADYKGKRLIQSPANAAGERMTLAFLELGNPGLVGIGNMTTVQRAIDAQLTSQSITANAEMMAIVSDVAANNNAWAVGRFDAIASQANLPAEISSRMPPVKWFSAAGHVNGGISGTLRAEAIDDESAELLRRQVSGVLALGEMVSKSDPTAGALVKSLQMSGTGKTVALTFAIPAEVLALLPQMAGAQTTIK